jgi:hypothetical protein
VFRIQDKETIAMVLGLTEQGLSDYEVARRTGVSRSTVQNWRRFGVPTGHDAARDSLKRPLDEGAYAYLLGLYLGDGHVAPAKGSWVLRITLDASYPGIVRECVAAMGVVATCRVTALLREKGSVVVIASCGHSWGNLLPQRGPGKKHERKIELVDWQLLITRRFTREFIRGLIHSDGSRCINRFSVKLPSGRVGRYAYPRYFFTNYSEDIRRIFRDHCDLLGIRWSQSNPRNISVAHRTSVGLLDSFVGPKT